MLDKVCIRIDSVSDDGTVTFSAFERLPYSLRISATDKSGGTSETTVNLSCAVDDAITNLEIEADCGSPICEPVIPSRDVSVVFYDANGRALTATNLNAGNAPSFSFSASQIPSAASNYDYFIVSVKNDASGSWQTGPLRFSDDPGDTVAMTYVANHEE